MGFFFKVIFHLFCNLMKIRQHFCLYIRGLGFKFVDFLYKSSDVCHIEIKMISSENIFFYLSYKLLSIALLIIVSTQQ